MTAMTATNATPYNVDLIDHQPREEVTAAIHRPGASLAEMMAAAFEGYADRIGFLRRRTVIVEDETGRHRSPRLGTESDTQTFGQFWTTIREVAGAWHADGVRPGDMVGILGFTSPDFVVADMAANHLGAVTVPLPNIFSTTALGGVLAELDPVWAIASVEALPTLVEAIVVGGKAANLLVINHDDGIVEDVAALKKAKADFAAAGRDIPVLTLAALYQRGRATPPAPLFKPAPGEDPLSTIYYTSGSTGLPKGALHTQRLVKPLWLQTPQGAQVILHHHPLSHSLGRAYIINAIARGGLSYFAAKSDLSTLFEDLAWARPTNVPLVPRIIEVIYQRFAAELDRRIAAGGEPTSTRAALIKETRDVHLGGRIKLSMFGAAPLSAELRAFISEVLGFEITEMFGTTELGGVICNKQVLRPPVIEYKLVDVPELGYFNTDKPYPRGEFCVKSASVIAGYYKQPEVWAQMFDEDGFYKSGDIMAEIDPDRLVYVDRRNNVVKLAQGEFVAIANLEASFAAAHPALKQVYIYGNSSRSFLLGVVVPNRQELPAGLGEAATKAALLDALRSVALEQDLNSYEVPRDILVEDEPFSSENGLLTNIGKYRRPSFIERYGERLEGIYKDIADQQEAELRGLRERASDMPVLEAVCRAAQVMFGKDVVDMSGDVNFVSLGGDSLSALSFSLLIEELLGVTIEVGTIIHPTRTLASMAREIEARKAGGRVALVSSTEVHGANRASLKASDLTIDRFIAPELLSAAVNLRPIAETDPRCVLLTGATGHLGRAMCLEWLDRADRTGARLICIVRAPDNQTAYKRLRDSLDTGDAELLAWFDERAAQHLLVLAGDLAAPRLDLDEDTWARLAQEVDVIYHPGALVNHKLPYGQLFGPNVAGTAETIRLALTARRKRIVFVSTVAAAGTASSGYLREDANIRDAIPEWMPGRGVAGSYADGYVSSKWASEILLLDAHERFGVPSSVFRSDMILAHSRYTGLINVPDAFTRWLISIIQTGLAPRSFYSSPKVPGTRPHYDGMPVDFSAKSVVQIGEAHSNCYVAYHLVNGHDDGVSLDSFVDWIEATGHAIRRIDNYDEWFRRFEARLRSLPEQQRQGTILPLISSYAQPLESAPGSPTPNDLYEKKVRDLSVGGGEIPHITAPFIAKCVADVESLALVRSAKPE